jgi:hypothetical protein
MRWQGQKKRDFGALLNNLCKEHGTKKERNEETPLQQLG